MTNDELCYTIMCIEKIENEQNQQSLSLVELEIFFESLFKTILNEKNKQSSDLTKQRTNNIRNILFKKHRLFHQLLNILIDVQNEQQQNEQHVFLGVNEGFRLFLLLDLLLLGNYNIITQNTCSFSFKAVISFFKASTSLEDSAQSFLQDFICSFDS